MSSRWVRRAKASLRSSILLVEIILVTALAVVAAAFLVYVWSGWDVFGPLPASGASEDGSTFYTPEDIYGILKISLTVVGGVYGVTFLVMKYREGVRAEADSLRLVDGQIVDAVAQLGDDKPVVRLAGVYALAKLSDLHPAYCKQQVVDILCGYLRSERRDDRLVESAIIKVIEKHVGMGGDKEVDYESGKLMDAPDSLSWSFCDFDLSGACFSAPFVLEEGIINGRFDLSNAKFDSRFCLYGIWFWGPLVFDGARFRESAVFASSRTPEAFGGLFSKCGFDTSFKDAVFERGLIMSGLSFQGPVSFNGCRASGELNLSHLVFFDRVDFAFAEGTPLPSTFEDVSCKPDVKILVPASWPGSGFSRKAANPLAYDPFDELLFDSARPAS